MKENKWYSLAVAVFATALAGLLIYGFCTLVKASFVSFVTVAYFITMIADIYQRRRKNNPDGQPESRNH